MTMAQQVKDYENYSATYLHYDECKLLIAFILSSVTVEAESVAHLVG